MPRGATLRLPAGTPEAARRPWSRDGLTAAELAGFRIVGDAATPLGIGLLARDRRVARGRRSHWGRRRAALELAAGGRVARGQRHPRQPRGRAGDPLRRQPRIATTRSSHRTALPSAPARQSWSKWEPGVRPEPNVFTGITPGVCRAPGAAPAAALGTTASHAAGAHIARQAREMRRVFDRFGRYEIRHEIGRGGMAVVFLADRHAFGASASR